MDELQLREMLGDLIDDELRVHRVDQKVRIAERMHIALRAVEARGNLEHPHADVRRDSARSAGGDLIVPRTLQERREPA